MTLEKETLDYHAGYHAAMLEIAELCLTLTKEAQARHAKASARGFFGGPSATHYIELGKGRAFQQISDHAFKAGNTVFIFRSKK